MSTQPTRTLDEWINLTVRFALDEEIPPFDDFTLIAVLLQELTNQGNNVPETTRGTICGVAGALLRRASQDIGLMNDARRKLADAMAQSGGVH